MSLWQETGAVAAARVTCVAYDSAQALVWAGDAGGRVASFYGPQLLPYTAFAAHAGAVAALATTDKRVLTLGPDGVRAYQRTGLLASTNAGATGDALLLLNNQEFLVALGRRIKRFSIEPQIKETGHFSVDAVPDGARITHMRTCAPNVALGLSNGQVVVVEPVTFDPVLAPIAGHGEALTDMECRQNVLVTCGLCRRRFGGLVPDVFAACHDPRTGAALPPLTASSGATFVRLHPKSPNHAILLGPSGLLTFIDSRNVAGVSVRQVLTSTPLVGMDINAVGDSLVVAEQGALHHWSANPARAADDTFAGLPVPTAEGPLPDVPLDGAAPLSLVGMPYFNQPLLSQWPRLLAFEVGMPLPRWDGVASSLVAQSHAECRRRRRASSFGAPKFLSEKERFGGSESFALVDMMRDDDSAAKGRVPKLWRQVHIHYSKFGVDDFDFDFYNCTPHSGLETLATNPFCNAVIQLLRWCAPVYNTTLRAFAAHNFRALPLTGELAIVFDMLAKARGHQCRATNFVETLSLEPSVAGVFEGIVDALVGEHEREIGAPAPLRAHLALTLRRKEYGSCGMQNVCAAAALRLRARSASPWAIQSGLSRTGHETAHCAKCDKPHQLAVAETVLEAGDVLFVQVQHDAKFKQLQDARVPAKFGITAGAVKPTLDFGSSEYTLRGYVAEIANDAERHAVAVVRIDEEWFLFNDFLVTKLSEQEALDFQPEWKTASLLLYQRRDSPTAFDDSWTEVLDTRLLYEPRIVSGNVSAPLPETALLKPDEPIPDLVALDAEFVLLSREISELYSDGSKTLIEPKKLGLARVSVVRNDGSVFIDDRVESTREIIDYLTAFSGVEPGDLDPESSPYGLVTRSTATRRLWILINKGTKFVGHALSNDFRTINIYVPPSQFFDTIKLFHDQDRNGFRRLGLKFLIWAIFNDFVQTGNHDSVQDALSALRLYEKYVELEKNEGLDEVLADISAKGQKHNFKVPREV